MISKEQLKRFEDMVNKKRYVLADNEELEEAIGLLLKDLRDCRDALSKALLLSAIFAKKDNFKALMKELKGE